MKSPPVHGLLVLDKPPGLTSRAVVDRASRWFPRGTRLGHAGTLDPLATGVLVVCAGVATRLIEYVQRMDKTYRTGLLLGARSTTDDAEGTVTLVSVECPPDETLLLRSLSAFVGEIDQVPPAFSAAKITGRRAYELARRGQSVSLAARRVRIDRLDLLTYDYPRVELEVRCGKGTYVRSLARDLGERLGCGALVKSLRRTQIGPFDVADALTLDADCAAARSRLLPVTTAVVDLPHAVATPPLIECLRHGQSIPLASVSCAAGMSLNQAEAAILDPAGALIAVVAVDRVEQQLYPVKVLA